jgi:hypothetical protein
MIPKSGTRFSEKIMLKRKAAHCMSGLPVVSGIANR